MAFSRIKWKEKTKTIMELAGIAGGFGLSITVFATFIQSYQTGARTININIIGESNIELVLLCMLLPMIFYAVLMNIKRIAKEGKHDAVD